MLAESGSDPDVERLLEGFAFLTARLRQKLDDELPELTQSLVDALWPDWLRPIPPICMLQFEPVRVADKEQRVVPRGVVVESKPVDGTRCRFRTTLDVEVPPLRLASLRLAAAAPARLEMRLTLNEGVTAKTLGIRRLRLHAAGPMAVSAALHDLLVRHTVAVELVAGDRRIRLPARSLRAIGDGPDAALLGAAAPGYTGFAQLREWSAFPSRFLFSEVSGLEAAAKLGEVTAFDLVCHLDRVPDGIPQLSESNLLLGCTPAVNLFEADADPLAVDPRRREYRLRPSGEDPTHREISAVESVSGIIPGGDKPKPLARMFRGGRAPDREAPAWLSRRSLTPDGRLLTSLSFSGSLSEFEALSIQLTCTNGRLVQGIAPGDVSIAGPGVPPTLRVRNLAKPTPHIAPSLGGQLDWRLLAQLGLNWRTLADVEGLRSTLEIHHVRAATDMQARQALKRMCSAIISVAARPDTQVSEGALVRGVCVELVVREDGFDGEGDIALFAAVLDELIAQRATLNSFGRLRVRGEQTGLVLDLPARLGSRRLV
jgi:type VI secretion system protein ImpG